MSKQRIKTALSLALAGAFIAATSASVPTVAAMPDKTRSSVAPVSTPVNGKLRREVFGFVNYYNLGDSSVGYPSWDMSLLSTVAYFGLHVNSGNGFIVPPVEYDETSTFPSLILRYGTLGLPAPADFWQTSSASL